MDLASILKEKAKIFASKKTKRAFLPHFQSHLPPFQKLWLPKTTFSSQNTKADFSLALLKSFEKNAAKKIFQGVKPEKKWFLALGDSDLS